MKVDVDSVAATGYRASELLGFSIYNDKGEKIGRLDDFIISANEEVAVAVIAVGGFLGKEVKLVAIPAVRFEIDNQGHLVVPGTTMDELIALPEFSYQD